MSDSGEVLDDEARYRAVRSRDQRFDGMFFTGVRTTGIYCRPSCPARTPNRSNVTFYRSAAQAQAAGLRACKRCRPDVTPGSPEWNARADLVGRAMRLIGDGVVDRDGVDGLAGRLGYSTRHVHRALLDEVGAGPLRLARTQRAHAARVLLETTPMPVTEVAYAAGFASIRQLNATVQEVYAATPSELRRARSTGLRGSGADGGTGRIEVRLAVRQPADLAAIFAFLAARAVTGIEEVRGATYARSLPLPHGPGIVELAAAADHVRLVMHLADPRDLAAAVARCRRLLDLDADPAAIDAVLGADQALGLAVATSPGIRVPGAVDGAEMAVRAVVGQQISVAGARTIAGRLVTELGTALPAPVAGVTHVFPSADAIASMDPARLPMPRRRAATLIELATRIADGRVVLDAGADRNATEQALRAIAGIGPWTAGYLRMRALGDPDVFLPTDLGVRAGLARAGLPVDELRAGERASMWRPWRSYALLHLWRLGAAPPARPPASEAINREAPSIQPSERTIR